MLLFALIGCPSPAREDSAAACEDEPSPGAYACVVAEGALPADGVPSELALAGTVTETGTGVPPEGCVAPEGWIGQVEITPDAAATTWLRVFDTSGATYTVAAQLTDGAIPVAVGDEVNVSWAWEGFEPFNGALGRYRLHVADAGGASRYFLAYLNGLEGMAIPADAPSIVEGAVYATCPDECMVHLRHALDVGGVSIEAGEWAEAGGARVWNGGVDHPEDVACSEMETHFARVGVVWAER